MFQVRMKRILSSGVFWGTVVLYAAIMAAGAWEDIMMARDNPRISLPYLYTVTTTVGISTVLVPIITMIPFACFYVEELEKKATYYYLIRCDKRRYYLSNIFTAISSSILVSAGALCLFFLAGAAFGARFLPSDALLSFYEGSCFEILFYEDGLWKILIMNVVTFLAITAPWGTLCLAVSVLSKNKYIVVAFPFILQNAFSYLVQLTPVGNLPIPLDPLLLPNGALLREWPYGGVPYLLCYQLVLTAGFSVFYYLMSKRRFQREGI